MFIFFGIVISINQHLQIVNFDAQQTSSVHIGWNTTLNQILLWLISRLSYSQNVHERFKNHYLFIQLGGGHPKEKNLLLLEWDLQSKQTWVSTIIVIKNAS